jgi:hypothetical protein
LLQTTFAPWLDIKIKIKALRAENQLENLAMLWGGVEELR